MSTDKEGMVNGSSTTSRVSSNFAPARTAPGVHSAPCRRFYFLQMESEVSAGWFLVVFLFVHFVGPYVAARPLSAKSCKHDEPLAQTRASANDKIAIDPFKSASA